MASANATQKRLMAERAEALAYLLLTGRASLDVHRVEHVRGVDFLVSITAKGKQGLRHFGVEVKSDLDPVPPDRANRVVEPAFRAAAKYGPFPIPVVLFLFTMRDDGSWYTWVAEPSSQDEGAGFPALRTTPDAHPLDAAALDRLVNRVDQWYDANYEARTTAAPPGKGGRKA